MILRPATCDVMTVTQGSEVNAIGSSLPYTQDDWWAKRRATDLLMEDIGGVVTRVGDETVGEMWSLFDGTDVLNEVDPQFAKNIETHIGKVLKGDPFHVSANTDPKGDRSLAPQDQDPDMLLNVVKETDAGIVVRGQNMKLPLPMPIKPSPNRPSPIGAMLSCRIMRSGLSVISVHRASSFCVVAALLGRMGGCPRVDHRDYPLANRFDEVDTIVIFDNVLIPWENVLFYRHTRAAIFIRATLHRYSAFAFVQRTLKQADQMIGTALFNARQTGLEKQPAVQEKLSELAIWREGINAHLTASIALGETFPAGLMMPNQSLLMTGRCHALNNLPKMMHIARELCGGQICVTPNVATFESPETKPWMDKYYTINDHWVAEDRRKLLAFARDLLNSDYAGHRLTFQLFAQSPPFAQSAAVYRNFDWDGPLSFVRNGAGLSDNVMHDVIEKASDGAVSKHYADALRKSVDEL